MSLEMNQDLTQRMEGLLEDEVSCLRFILDYTPAYLNHYIDHMEKGRSGILHKLASSILREDIGQVCSRSIDLKKIGRVLVVNLNEDSTEWKSFFKNIQEYPLREDLTYKVFQKEDEVYVFPVWDQYAYHRVETTDEILRIDESGVHVIKLASELVRGLFGDNQFENLETFMKELDNGTANLTLAYMYQKVWEKEINQEAKKLQSNSTIDYLLKKRKMSHHFSPSLFLEQLVVEGHQLHPGAKTKTGLKKKDVFQYAPEFHQTFNVRFVAVKKSHVRTTGASHSLLEPFYPEVLETCVHQLEQRQLDPQSFEILPVHEWQYDYAIPDVYAKEINAGDVIMIDDVHLPVGATSSFRTVYPINEEGPALKLAVNSQMTSTVRSISTQTAMNSTVFTNMMEKVMQQEDQLDEFLPLNEIAGAAFISKDEVKSRNLTMLLRESIEERLTDDEIAVAGPALYADSPVSGQPMLFEVVDHYSNTKGLPKTEAAVSFFSEYISTLLPGYLTMMTKYGIALEGHLQNSVPVFKGGRLSRFYFRDWGGARIYRDRLNKQGISAEFMEGSVSVTNDISSMHNKMYYTVFQNHFGELIRLLVSYTGLAEDTFWLLVKKVCKETMEDLSEQKEIKNQVEIDREFLFQPTVMHKALTKMRLTDKKGYSFSEVSNPLAISEEIHD
ncbi:IucA/IucC family protein [Halobacillus yeomjeoni]|uniref:IucA/IucC family siderophore biosynthesis protein n=1 Tax=Halobacillus yeomjeoni TaxID=311194 RepID=A0A931HUG5_9BACI|nr:IucA/IucC family protein [Halobacillus yeomjeoni]MBH0229750.1 IucA/IucC family siderophore biosynthesis protein [Halobacillus yeomjeoni]